MDDARSFGPALVVFVPPGQLVELPRHPAPCSDAARVRCQHKRTDALGHEARCVAPMMALDMQGDRQDLGVVDQDRCNRFNLPCQLTHNTLKTCIHLEVGRWLRIGVPSPSQAAVADSRSKPSLVPVIWIRRPM